MSRSFELSLCACGLLLLGLLSLHGDLLLLSLLLVVYLLASYSFAPNEIQLKVERTLSSERVSVEMPVEVTLKITNAGPTLEEIQLIDPVPSNLRILKGSARHIFFLGSGRSITVSYTVSGQRGYYPFHQVIVEVRDHFGLTHRKTVIRTSGQLLVMPGVLRLSTIPIRTRRTRVYAGSIPARVGGRGVEFFGVRQYQSGDPPRLINWRASTRHAAVLYSNEYEQERVADVGIVLDGREKTNILGRGHSLFEHSVMACAALADALLSQGNRVGLLDYGRFLRWTIPGYGRIQRERILQALANAETGSSVVFSDLEHIPVQLFPAHSQIILVSPLDVDDDQVLVQLRARGYQVMVISPDPITFEMGYLGADRSVRLAGRLARLERAVLLNALRRAGIQVLDWDVSQPFDQVVKKRLGHPPAYWRNVGVKV